MYWLTFEKVLTDYSSDWNQHHHNHRAVMINETCYWKWWGGWSKDSGGLLWTHSAPSDEQKSTWDLRQEQSPSSEHVRALGWSLCALTGPWYVLNFLRPNQLRGGLEVKSPMYIKCNLHLDLNTGNRCKAAQSLPVHSWILILLGLETSNGRWNYFNSCST